MELQASSQVYRTYFLLALEYHVEGAGGKVQPDSSLADEWYETAHWMVHHEEYLTPAPLQRGLGHFPVNSQLGVGPRGMPGRTGSAG